MSQITDKLGRPLRDLRISVTDRCNFRCTYCMPRELFGPDHVFLPRSALLSYEELVRLAHAFVKLGVKKIRITGGEPLLRRDLPVLISKLTQEVGIEDISLTTNGVLLPRLAGQLKDAGLKRINVSLDSLDTDRFAAMNGQSSSPQKVIDGIDAAQSAGLSVKVNMVAKLGMNDCDILPMTEYFRERKITLRFIEFMDVGETNQWKLGEVVPAKQILDTIASRFSFKPVDPSYRGEVATRYRFDDTDCEFGIITSITNPFCGDCNRARISAEGDFYTCLFASSGISLKEKIRSGVSDDELLQFLSRIWLGRHDRYSEDRHKGVPAERKKKVEMSYIGG
ncbi:GTP 3',8-cyclase MoaA [Pelagicoccus sp. SDUM812003]|uniref:GTP 3',8-cyclase MoaA n=1 Tax=Pelagicoccus sp. SDUM812003 TaxID=3041267 RepID=UPI00280D053C|nr:GTP 3',8-cyclase MoaA [Pelagicoccus sp. SDUM812003]MDQ8204223.1 GTP 3',8-cyclase MoaA [Pelagicoccus sp. SDUM812003]